MRAKPMFENTAVFKVAYTDIYKSLYFFRRSGFQNAELDSAGPK